MNYNYGKIAIGSIHDHTDFEHLMYCKHKNHFVDTINVESLNKTLNEWNEYIITGFFCGHDVCLLTNRLSFISTARYPMCRHCREVWKSTIYTDGEICECSGLIKNEHHITFGVRGNMKLSYSHINMIKQLFMEHFSQQRDEIFKIHRKYLNDDTIWFNEIVKTLIDIVRCDDFGSHRIDEAIYLKIDKERMELLSQVSRLNKEKTALYQRIDSLIKTNQDQFNNIEELNIQLQKLQQDRIIRLNIMNMIQEENETLHKIVKKHNISI